jgi:8-amino-7-oxononanoate synthase
MVPQDVQNSVADLVLAQVRAIVDAELADELTLDTPLYELGVDSLAVMDAINRVEELFGMRFREEWLYEIDTSRDLVERVIATTSHAKMAELAKSTTAVVEPVVKTPEAIPPTHYDVTQFPECVAFQQRLEAGAQAGFANPFFRVNESASPPCSTVEGRPMVRYTSFDYLGLSGHPKVVAAAHEAIDRYGTSAGASRLVGGNHAILEELDQELASFLGTEAAIVFPSGYGTNASVFGHLFGKDDLILYDELAHNSIVQGAMLSQAGRRSFRHNDFDLLDRLLTDLRGSYRRVVVAVEGAYSMDGDYPDLPHLLKVKHRHRALLYVDEAHSVGAMGATGRGICEHFGVDPAEGDLWMGTISKALASGGGYLAGRKELVSYLRYTTPAFVFATACSPANAAASLAALRVIKAEPQHVERLRDRSTLFLNLAQDAGLNTGNSHDTPIVPVILGDSFRCIRISKMLLERGIDAQPILFPAVRESAARMRFFITAAHTEEQIVTTVSVLTECVAATAK